METPSAARLAPLLALVIGLTACRSTASSDAARSAVLVLGMTHDGHLESEAYGIDEIQDIVRRYDPDFILAEIPPDRFERARLEFLANGTIEEPRVRRFPEYIDAIFPLLLELDFEIVPCAAWTRPMAEARSAKLALLERTRPEDSAAVEAGMAWIQERVAVEGLDPDAGTLGALGIHTRRYDSIVEAGLEPYDRLFNDELGPGGWTNINRAHYAHIAAALDEHKGSGKRFLVTFGSWHKYWILKALRERDDVALIPLRAVLAVE